eukprot:1192353-Prorocentrum_minimum.AAC.9
MPGYILLGGPSTAYELANVQYWLENIWTASPGGTGGSWGGDPGARPRGGRGPASRPDPRARMTSDTSAADGHIVSLANCELETANTACERGLRQTPSRCNLFSTAKQTSLRYEHSQIQGRVVDKCFSRCTHSTD